jgi:hypothetical protein
MNEALHGRRMGVRGDRRVVRPIGVFAAWRLQAYGYTLAAAYAGFILCLYHLYAWLLNKDGVPVYHDFTTAYVAGWLALHGQTRAIYVASAFRGAEDALVGAGRALFSNWPYPPIYFLILAPFATLPYVVAFLTWGLLTLLGYVVVVYLIVRQRPAVAVALASPFAAWNFIAGQSGALTALLFGASLLALERRPVLAGLFVGCLTYKPQFGILLPVALVAARQWRTMVSAAAATAFLAGASIAAFGIGPWEGFPRELVAQAGLNLVVGPGHGAPVNPWGQVQTIYGLIRRLHGGAMLAWLAQGVMAFGVAVIVWKTWRSGVRYGLRAATLSAGALIATPYAFAYDLAAIAVPIAFLARDQIDHGLLRGEQTALLTLFAASLVLFMTAGKAPGGALVMLALFWLILRRSFQDGPENTALVAASH